MNNLWVEKYRPKKLDEICGNKDEIHKLKQFIRTNYFTNIILSGEPGTGKTTALLCLAREYFGENWQEYTLELNASDDRGIETVRNTIKTFCSKKTPFNKFKIIILDEADNMTINAQYSLRKTIDYYEKTCKFFFTCNHLPSLIEPIQDRCMMFNFGEIDYDEIVKQLREICNQENMKIDDETLYHLKYYSNHNSDLRAMINLLEFINMHCKDNISLKVLEDLFEKPPLHDIKLLIDVLFLKDKKKIFDIITKILNRGCSVYDIFDGIFYIIKNDEEKDDFKKLEFLEILSDFHTNSTNGFQTLTQLYAFCIKYCEKV